MGERTQLEPAITTLCLGEGAPVRTLPLAMPLDDVQWDQSQGHCEVPLIAT